MRTSAAGDSGGFTLLELLLVLAIVAMASAGITLALRDSAQARLETDAVRLAALLESARAQSRASGIPVVWRITASGFALDGLHAANRSTSAGTAAPPTAWLDAQVRASTPAPLLLGPEPLIAPQSVRLWLQDQPQRSLQVATDGVRPFSVLAGTP